MKPTLNIINRIALALLLAATLISPAIPLAQSQAPEKVSNPGHYSGFSQPLYDGFVRTSEYVTVRDGTMLAVDIFRPAQNGRPVDEPLPVIWAQERYHRASIRDGKLVTHLDRFPWLKTLLNHGYVVGVVDTRGAGASFKSWPGPFTRQEATDAYDITEWFAARPYSNGRIAMYGRSYQGITQYMAASAAPPHLKAIFPQMAMFDLYSFTHPGGIFRLNYARNMDAAVKKLDGDESVAPVDNDAGREMLSRASQEHRSNTDFFQSIASLPYRDSKLEKRGSVYTSNSPSTYLNEIRNSGVAVYHLAGWQDLFTRDAFLWFKNLTNPQKLIIGPWSHTSSAGLDLAAEHLRWYDFWLKGIDNNVMSEAPIHYYTLGAPEGQEWRSAWQWPLPEEASTSYYFTGGPSGSVDSANDGTLSQQPPAEAQGKDDYAVDYSASSGTATRWTNGYAGPFGYQNMVANDKRALTYTTAPLQTEMVITGHPVVTLWISSPDKDADFFVYLEDVLESGYSRYVTEGALRASGRSVSQPPFNYLNLPYHRSFREDLQPLTGEPAEIAFDLYPTSYYFGAGHRIRVTLACADKDNAFTPQLPGAPAISVHRNTAHASRITLPVIPGIESRAIASEGRVGNVNQGIIFLIFSVLLMGGLLALAIFKIKRKIASRVRVVD